MWTVSFWKDAAERAIKTGAQVAIAAVTSAATLDAIDWKVAGMTIGTAVVLSLLTSIVSSQVGNKGTASAVK